MVDPTAMLKEIDFLQGRIKTMSDENVYLKGILNDLELDGSKEAVEGWAESPRYKNTHTRREWSIIAADDDGDDLWTIQWKKDGNTLIDCGEVAGSLSAAMRSASYLEKNPQVLEDEE